MEQGKSENADDMKQMTDVTKQNKRRKRRQEADRGRHEADQKKTRGMRFPVGPNSVSLG
ncbi:hypothetical protein T4E_2746 [Trichinella pseudospiralis]|uniref:Uncharacterized protein n=1 Tax=Trichinella pseudospiralis TaxID=6337 RepID=A0A0V0XLX2_TRIPS|nr:hypothetical protein T4E_2746 [Trichinella pseudospiralis]